MRCGVNVPNFGDFADPRLIGVLAERAESAGWDGLFVWDHLVWDSSAPVPVADPWILLTVAALATRRIRLGAMVTPVARRRVATLARQVVTLDQLSGGRVIFGCGLGAPLDEEFGSFGEPTDPRVVAAKLDEGLEALSLLWTGEPVSYRGRHVTVKDVQFLPTSPQGTRVPVWVGGNWPNRAPMRRAARWDGAFPMLGGEREGAIPDPGTLGELRSFLQGCRGERGVADFDIVVSGSTAANRASDTEALGRLADAGATWWLECAPWDDRLTEADPVLRRVDAGPPMPRA